MFKGVRQLLGGHLLVDDVGRRRTAQFWDMSFNRRKIPAREATEAFRAMLQGTIQRQMAADVPVMAYLSGGIDSSSLVAGAHRIDPKVKA